MRESRERERRRIIIHTLPTSHLLLPSNKGRKNKPLTGKRREQREREQREREEKDYNTHLADISSGLARAVPI